MDFPGFSLDMGALKQARQPDPAVLYDLLILGGGPAAMTAAIYAARKMLKIAVITRDFGGQILETSEVENWLGYQHINAKDLTSNFEGHVKSFDLPVAMGEAVAKVEKDKDAFKVTTERGKVYKAWAVLLATGKRHRPLGVPGEKELLGRGVAYCATCDAPFYKKKRVVVAGGGNSAFTTAFDLMKVEAAITMLNFSKGWGADAELRKRIENYGQARLIDNHEIVKIEGKTKVEAVRAKDRKSGKEQTIECDGVFVEIGLISNTAMVKDLVALNRQGEVEVDCSCRTDVPGFFAAGDVTTVPYKQIVIAAGEGSKAALAAFDYLVASHKI
jgi:alkyl hydroperoxide reductase subunit F